MSRGSGLTGDVEVNELTSPQRLDQTILRRTAEASAFLFSRFRKSEQERKSQERELFHFLADVRRTFD